MKKKLGSSLLPILEVTMFAIEKFRAVNILYLDEYLIKLVVTWYMNVNIWREYEEETGKLIASFS